MGVLNFLVEGLSGTGKTSVCDGLLRRGVLAIHGDRVLAYQGDPITGEPTATQDHEHHVWDAAAVRRIAADRRTPMTFFCGGLRNHAALADVFDRVFVLEADPATLRRRLASRPADEFGGRTPDRDLVLALHARGAGVPTDVAAIRIDATRPLATVVDEILRSATGPAGR